MVTPSPLARRILEHVDAHRARVAAAVAPAPTVEAVLGFRHQPGDTVVDLVTGEEVTVHAAHRQADLVFAARPEID